MGVLLVVELTHASAGPLPRTCAPSTPCLPAPTDTARPGASVVAHGSVLAGTAEVDGVLPSDRYALVTDLDV
ncbi:hypothetical protein [Cellulomonas cellasea]|uniref:Uncharacterized protein n=1 Tax=Cellulomonas cellasea TaxID=43670 RepID=A0A7W4UF45_9CELL|nr:hypothetical protein [Cellulomonas cellasea]MBB2923039.1 hypothetical protein [Cellulomonas cellasea]